jgi:hypothetical protein
VFIETFDRQGGNRIAGTVHLGLQKDRDTQSLQGFSDQAGNPIQADVAADREWESPRIDCTVPASNGFDTLVVYEAGGRPIYRSLNRQQPAGQQPPAQQIQQQRQPREPKTEIDFYQPQLVEKDNGKKVDITLTGVISRGGAPLQQAVLDFYYNGSIEQACQCLPGCKTDDNGRFSFTFEGKSAEGKRVPLEVQVRGTGARKKFEVELPKAPQSPEVRFPVELNATVLDFHLTSTGIDFLVSVCAKDKSGKPTKAGKIVWHCGEPAGEIELGNHPDILAVSLTGPNDLVLYSPDWDLVSHTLITCPSWSSTISPESQFKVGIEGDVVYAKKFQAVIPMETCDKFGKNGSGRVSVKVIKGQFVDFFDADSNSLLGHSLTAEFFTGSDGKFRLGVNFKPQFEVILQLSDAGSKQKRTLKLVYHQ